MSKIVAFSNITISNCIDFIDEKTIYIVCGGLFPEYGTLAEIDSYYEELKRFKYEKRQNEQSFIIILSPRDLFIITSVIKFSKTVRDMKTSLSKVYKLAEHEYEFIEEDISMYEKLDNILDTTNTNKYKYNCLKTFFLKQVRIFESVDDTESLKNLLTIFVMNTAFTSVYSEKFELLFPKLFIETPKKHYVDILSYLYKKRDIMKFLLENSHIMYEDQKNVYCTHSNVVENVVKGNFGYKDSIMSFLKTKKLDCLLTNYIDSFRNAQFSGSKCFIVGDAKSECDSPIYKETDSADIIFLNCSIGRLSNKIFYNTKSFMLQSEYKVCNVYNEVCFGTLTVEDDTYSIEGIGAADYQYSGTIKSETFIKPTEKIKIEGEYLYPSDEWNFVYKGKKKTIWICKAKDIDAYIIYISNFSNKPFKEQKEQKDDISVVSDKILDLVYSPENKQTESFKVDIDGLSNYEQFNFEEDNSISLTAILDENSVRTGATGQTRKLKSLQEILESLDV